MTAAQRAECLFTEAVKLGCDTPTEAMVGRAIVEAEDDAVNELIEALHMGGFAKAAEAILNWKALRISREQEG